MFLAFIEESGGGGLQAAGDDFFDDVAGHLLVAFSECKGDHAYAVFVAFEVAAAVESFQRVAGVVLVSSQEGLEAEAVCVGLLEEAFDELEGVLIDDVFFVVIIFQEEFELLSEGVEEDGVLVDVLEEELAGCFPVGLETDLSVVVVDIQHRIQRVVVKGLSMFIGQDLLFAHGRFSLLCLVGCALRGVRWCGYLIIFSIGV